MGPKNNFAILNISLYWRSLQRHFTVYIYIWLLRASWII